MLQGLIYAGMSALLSGSFAVLPKCAMVQAHRKHAPVPRPVTAWWLALGFVCASCAWALFIPQGFRWWGLLSGLLWALSVVGRVSCIDACGMCTGNATPDVITAMTAWAYDALYNKARFTCAPVGELGYFLLALCLISIYVLEQQGHYRHQLLAKLYALSSTVQGIQVDAGHGIHSTAAAPDNVTTTVTTTAGQQQEPAGAVTDHACAADTAEEQHMSHPLLPQHQESTAGGPDKRWQSITWGQLLGVVSGVCSGLSQLPFTMAPPGGGGIHFILASSLGMLLFATINVFLHRIWHKVGFVNSITHVDLYASAMAPYGIAGGAVLLASMVCGILAGGDDAVQFSGAKVMAEASILVSGAWGVLLFQELRSLLQVLFWLLSMQMLCSYAIIIAGRVVSC